MKHDYVVEYDHFQQEKDMIYSKRLEIRMIPQCSIVIQQLDPQEKE